jgi:hypothetical protein
MFRLLAMGRCGSERNFALTLVCQLGMKKEAHPQTEGFATAFQAAMSCLISAGA